MDGRALGGSPYARTVALSPRPGRFPRGAQERLANAAIDATGTAGFFDAGQAIAVYPARFGSDNATVGLVAMLWNEAAFASGIRQDILTTISISALVVALSLAVCGLVMLRRFVVPFLRIERDAQRLARGDTGWAVRGVGRADEIGSLARSLESLRQTLEAAQVGSDVRSLGSVLDTLPDALALIGPDGAFRHVSPTAQAVLQRISGSVESAEGPIYRRYFPPCRISPKPDPP